MILGVIQEAQLVKLPSDDDSDKLSKKSDSVAKPKPEDGIPKFDEVSRGKLYYMFIKSMGVRVFAVWLFSQFVWSVLEIIPGMFSTHDGQGVYLAANIYRRVLENLDSSSSR